MPTTLLRHLSQAWRALSRRPTAALATVATIALVSGAGTAVLTVVNATLLRPLPYPDSERLVSVYTLPPNSKTKADRNPLHTLDILRFRQQLRLAAAIEGAWQLDRTLGGNGDPANVSGARVTPGYLALFGGTPIYGRFWTEAEDRADARVVVLSHAVWTRHFGGSPDVIGKTAQIDRESYTIIGVLQKDFQPGAVVSVLWTPLAVREDNLINPGATFVQTVAKLAPGVTAAQLNAEVAARMQEIVASSPVINSAGWTAGVGSFREVQFGDRGPLLLLLALAVGVLALIAVANLANLQFARLTAQRAEWTLRAALGASRRDLMRQPFYEGTIVAAAGGAAGLLIAALVTPALVALDPVSARQIGALPVDWRVVLGAVAIAGVIAVVASVVPALRQARRDLAPGLASGGPRTVGSRFDDRLRRILVGAEMALSVVLLVAAALLLASLSRSSSRSPGFNPAGVLSAQLRVSDKAYPTTAARAQFVDTVVERLRGVPGVVDASTTLNPFVPGFSLFTMINIEGRPAADGHPYSIQFRRITPGFFQTMGIPMLAGRAFLPSDRENSQPVAIVSQLAARRYWPDEDPIGRRIERGGKLFTVVGVVGDTHELGLASPPAPTLYTAYAQSNPPTFPIALVVRVNGSDPYAASDGIRAAVLSVDPSQPIDRLISVDDYFSNGLGSDRLRGVVLLSFAAIGLLLATVGLYGVTASLVEERTREVGVRLVFGATPRQVWILMVSEAARMVTWGAAAGALVALGVGSALGSVVTDLSWDDAWSAVPAIVALAFFALVAAAIPALRAARSDPKIALT